MLSLGRWKQTELGEFEASLGYSVSSWPDRAVQHHLSEKIKLIRADKMTQLVGCLPKNLIMV